MADETEERKKRKGIGGWLSRYGDHTAQAW